MKIPIVVLSIVCVALCGAWYSTHSRAQKAAEESVKLLQTCSNQVDTIRTKLALEQGDASIAQSNYQSALDRRAVELATASNRLAQAQAQRAAAQTEIQRLQNELQNRTAELVNLQAARDELKQRVDKLALLPDELAQAQEHLAATEAKLNVLMTEWGALRVEHYDLLRQLDDLNFLRLQMAKVEEREKLKKSAAHRKTPKSPDPRLPLELLPDGTVRVATPVESTNK